MSDESRKCIVKVEGAPSGPLTIHDGRYVVAWNPHTVYGMLAITSTNDPRQARQFDSAYQALSEWNTVSNIQARRPDGRPNKPLTGITISISDAPTEEPKEGIGDGH